jgi:carboxyl-terminal processing protease
MGGAVSERVTFGIIARALVDLDDSHTFLVPPGAAGALDYGFTPRMFGERCFLVHVRPGSDAHAQGLAAGDELLAIEGQRPDRVNLWRTLHLLRLLYAQPDVTLSVRGPAGARQVTVRAQPLAPGRSVTFNEYLDSLRHKLPGRAGSHWAAAGDVLVWRLVSFQDGRAIAAGVRRARASRALVLDLRGNIGGDADALRRLTGALMPDPAPVTIGWLRARGGQRALTAERWTADRGFAGPLVVLVDSDSASAAEVLARTVQLRGRGPVIGDRSAGAVMLARTHVRTVSRGHHLVPYALSVTEAAVVMPDGSLLEKAGLSPDEMVLPSAEDLRVGRDPMLARAVALAGGVLTPEAAGRLFAQAGPD